MSFQKKGCQNFTSYIVLGVVLSACGGGSGSPEGIDVMVTLSGTAATGAAITEAEVTANCSDGSGFVRQILTKSDGGFEGQVAQAALPCALQVSKPGEQILLHSFAVNAGVTNITPLTDISISLASSDTPANWFNSVSPFNIESTLPLVKQSLLTSLEASGFTMPDNNFDPFYQAFSIGDKADQLLDDIQESLAASNTIESYAELIDVIKDGNINEFPLVTGDSANTAFDCFNAELYQHGVPVNMMYQATATDSTVTTESIAYEVTYNDGSNVHIDQTLETFSAGNNLVSTQSSIDDYDIPSTDGGTGLVVKNVSSYTTVYTDNNIPDVSVRLVVVDRLDFRLSEGEATTMNAAVVHSGTSLTWSLIRQGVRTYVTKEIITVPAGTFTACRFDSNLTYTGAVNHPVYGSNPTQQFNEFVTDWYAEDSGVLLKSSQLNGSTRELVSASINGNDI